MKVKIYRRAWGLFKIMMEIYDDAGELVISKKMWQGFTLKGLARRMKKRKARMIKLFDVLVAGR